MKDKCGQDVEYNDLIIINGNTMILKDAIDIPMIEMMKFQGYLHLFESEIELFCPYPESIENFPELYI